MSVICSDDFAGAAGALTTTPVGGLTYVMPRGQWSRDGSGHVSGAQLGGDFDTWVWVNASTADCTVKADLVSGNSPSALIVRVQDKNNHLLWSTDGNFYTNIANSLTSIATVGGLGDGVTATIVLSGTSIYCYANGVLQGTVTTSQFQTLTSHGLQTGNFNVALFDNFSVDSSTTPLVQPTPRPKPTIRLQAVSRAAVR